MKWVAVWIVFFLTGFMFFLNVDLDNPKYTMLYFIWDKGKDVIALLAFMAFFRRDKGILLKLIPVLVLLIFRIVWEPLSNVIGWSINDQRAGNIFFLLLILVYLIIFLKESKWRSLK